MRAQEFPAYIGCAGWSIPRDAAAHFPATGTHLERYGTRFSAVEINSSFYRPHRRQTYEKWAAAVPDHFRFAVKMPKTITHESRLKNTSGPLDSFLTEVSGLGAKLGPLLLQLPPSLQYDELVAREFFVLLRKSFDGLVVCEPRHPTWFTPAIDSLLSQYEVVRVAADPATGPVAGRPGGWSGLRYFRLHGTPRMYYSSYTSDFLAILAEDIISQAPSAVSTWCIFDNTARGAATSNALELRDLLKEKCMEFVPR